MKTPKIIYCVPTPFLHKMSFYILKYLNGLKIIAFYKNKSKMHSKHFN